MSELGKHCLHFTNYVALFHGHSSHIFETIFRDLDHCPYCGLEIVRDEEGELDDTEFIKHRWDCPCHELGWLRDDISKPKTLAAYRFLSDEATKYARSEEGLEEMRKGF